jgi:hypothetical protein
MITRFDKLQMELPHPSNPSPNSAAAVQELLGGKFGEMSTFRGRSKYIKGRGATTHPNRGADPAPSVASARSAPKCWSSHGKTAFPRRAARYRLPP